MNFKNSIPGALKPTKILFQFILSAMSLGFVSEISFAQDGVLSSTPIPGVSQKHMMEDSIVVHITDKGWGLFRNNLLSLATNLDLHLDQGAFSGLRWQAAKPIPIANLSKDPNTKKLIETVRNSLKDWFIKFPLIDTVQPIVQLGPTAYHLVFNKISLNTEPEVLKSLHKKTGLVLELDLEIKEIDLQSTQASLWSVPIPNQTKVTLNNPKVVIGGGKTPIIVRVPFYVKVDETGSPVFEVLSIQQDISKVNVDYGYESADIPKLQIIWGDQKYSLNQKTLESFLQKEKPALIQQITYSLGQFIDHQLPQLLNNKARAGLTKKLEEVKLLNPPGAPKGVTPFVWGLTLSQVEERDEADQVHLNTYIEDTLNPDTELKTSMANMPALINALNPKDYSIGLIADEALINRLLQLSFDRGYFSQIMLDGSKPIPLQCAALAGAVPSTKGKFIKLTEAPTVSALKNGGFTGTPGETFARLHVSLQVPKGTIHGLESLVLMDQFIVKFEMIVKIVATSPQTLGIQLWSVDASTIQFEDAFTFLGEIVHGLVVDAIEKEFKKFSQEWQCAKTSIPGKIQLPQIFGVQFAIQDLDLESNGHLVLYLNYNGSYQ